jgi:hypothetical protein
MIIDRPDRFLPPIAAFLVETIELLLRLLVGRLTRI